MHRLRFTYSILLCLLGILIANPAGAATFQPMDVTELKQAINDAQSGAYPGDDIIDLSVGTPFILTTVDNTVLNAGPNGLPVITGANGKLTFENGTIRRDTSLTDTTPFRLFFATSNANWVLDNVVLENGLAVDDYTTSLTLADKARGGAVYNSGILTVIDSTFEDNRALGDNPASLEDPPVTLPPSDAEGGAIFHDGSSLNISGSTFENNSAIGGDALVDVLGTGGYGHGGAIHSESATVGQIVDTQFTDNSAIGGDAQAVVVDLEISPALGGEASDGAGGAISLNAGTASDFLSLTFTGNTVTGGAGSAAVDIINEPAADIIFPSAEALGGAIYLARNAQLDALTLSTFTGNQALGQNASGIIPLIAQGSEGFGGAIALNDGTIKDLSYSAFTSNLAQGGENTQNPDLSNGGSGKGGAVYVVNGSEISVLQSSTFVGNSVEGGIPFIETGVLADPNNDPGSHGGAIYANESSLIIVNSTFSANEAQDHGGAIDIRSNREENDFLKFYSNTITLNIAGDDIGGGGIYVHEDADVSDFFSNIVAANTDGDGNEGADIVDNGSLGPIKASKKGSKAIGTLEIVVADYNLIGVAGEDSGHNILGGNNKTGTVADPLDPLLAPLAYNGGPSFLLTHALLPGSPAIDMGNNAFPATYDERGPGFLREVPPGQPDIGAFEVQAVPCVEDADSDTICDDVDNCVDVPNTDQSDVDSDGLGDVCDNCIAKANPKVPFDPTQGEQDCDPNDANEQPDADCDGMGDVCDFCPNDPTNSCDPGDSDGDGVQNGEDNCPGVANDDFSTEQNCIPDTDPNVPDPEPEQLDADCDGIGDACDLCPNDATNSCDPGDSDGDGVQNGEDNCPGVANDDFSTEQNCIPDTDPNVPDPEPEQLDADCDGIGDACDLCPNDPTNSCDPGDSDGDGVQNGEDNCPGKANPEVNGVQPDADADGMGDACDACPLDADDPLTPENESDPDGDGICNTNDNCSGVGLVDPTDAANPLQQDTDQDGIGNVCDTCTDPDGDGQGNAGTDQTGCTVVGDDPCPFDADNLCDDETLGDVDGDGVPNGEDNCPGKANPEVNGVQPDADGDGMGDACDACPYDDDGLEGGQDRDADGICNSLDNCADTANQLQQDTDQDGIGNACDQCTDQDGDTVCDSVDNCDFDPNLNQDDTDLDGIGNACDTCPADDIEDGDDTDSDGVCNAADRCPGSNDAQDTDGDGIPDGCDNCLEDDNLNQLDTDQDGTGDACDTCTDTDGDGAGNPGFNNSGCEIDEIDNCPFIANPSQEDFDDDGLGDRCDTIPGGATVIPGEPIPLPPIPVPVPAVAPVVGAELGVGALGPVLEAPAADIAVETAPSAEAVVDGFDPALDEEVEGLEEAAGCSSTGSNSASTMAMFLAALLLLRLKPRFRRNS